MNHLLIIVCFVISLISSNPIIDSVHHSRSGDETIVDTSTNYHVCNHDTGYVEVFCRTHSDECLGCKSCKNNWYNLGVGTVAVILALITLIVMKKQLKLSYQQVMDSNQQSKSSNKLAQESYNSFKTESERQHLMQQKTLNAIVKQTDKLHSTKQKSEIIDHFTGCYSLLEMMYDFLLKHFGDVVRDTKEYSVFVFDTLRPIVKDASAIKMLMSGQKEGNEEFLNALDICTGLTNLQIHNQKDMDELLERLAICKKAFENKKDDIDKELKENE